jgi:hypothetical protein
MLSDPTGSFQDANAGDRTRKPQRSP